MTPSRSTRSSSRRSSILKPYKSNQALQTLSANNSSNESSPATTSKFKRRVSFAEKKHVKEFCNSLEQGTVWDTSYEEHDLSNLKISSTLNHLSTNNEEIIHKGSIINRNQENYIPLASDEMSENNLNIKDCDLSKINRFNGLKNPLLNKNEMFGNLSSVISNNIQIQQNESVPSIDLQLASGNHITKSTIACNNFSEQFFGKTSKLTELHMGHHNSHNLNATSVQDIHMEFTEVVCPSMYNDIIYSKNNGLNGSLQNVSMDLTQPIPLAVNMLTNFQQGQNTKKSNSQCRLNNSNITIADQQSLMELTEVVPSIIKLSNNFNNADSSIHSVNNRTNGFDNSSMEITTAVPSTPLIFCNLESSNINKEMEDYNLNLAVNSDNKTTIFHDASMEITNAIKINTNVNMNCESISEFDQLVVPKEMDFQYSDEKTKLLNTPMEMTEAIPVNMYSTNINQEREQTTHEIKDVPADNNLTKLRSHLNYYKISHNCDKTRDCNEGMEFTEIITTSQNNLTDNVLVQSTSCSQRNISDENDSINLKSNNSVQITKDKKDNYETGIEDYESNISIQELVKPVLYSNTSMEIRETAMKRQHYSPNKNIVIDSTYVKESELLETRKNKNKNSLNHTVIHDNVLKDVTNSVVPSALNSNAILDKKSYVANDFLQCSKESTINIPVSTEIENSVNSSSNIILSELEQQNADALILEENSETNHVYNSLLNNYSSSIVTPEMNQNECLSYQQSQNIIPNPRRTYTIQPLSMECPCIEENSRICSTINNDVNSDIFCHESNDKTSCTQNSSNSTNNLQNDDSANKDVIFFNNTLEELHTISPPSFVYLDNLSDQDISTDACMKMHCDSDNIKSSDPTETENASKDTCNIENVNNVYEETSKIDQVVNVQTEKVNDNCSSVDVRLNLESRDSFVQEDDISVKLDPFSSLISKLKLRAESDEIIWNVYYENIERNLFVIGFICSSLLVVIYLKDHCDIMDNQPIKEIKMYSRLADDADALVSIVHRIIIEKLDVQLLIDSCKSYKDIFSILDYISTEVKLAMDFMFDVERISDVNLMEITQKSISFIARAKRKDIILRVTVEIKPFHKIEPQNIFVHCILGSVREDRVKELITNVKRDHTFLRRYINDVNEYIYIMEEFN